MNLYRKYDPARRTGPSQSPKAWAASRINYALFQVRSSIGKFSGLQYELKEVESSISRQELPSDLLEIVQTTRNQLEVARIALINCELSIQKHNASRPNHKDRKDDFYS